MLLLVWLQVANDTAAQSSTGALMPFYIFLGGVAGAAIKSLADFVINRRKVSSDIRKQDADVHLSDALAKKSQNEIIISVQAQLMEEQRLRMDMQKLLLDMQERLDGWIKRFEAASDEAAQVDEELHQLRQISNDCILGRKSYYEFCIAVKKFLADVQPIIEDRELLRDAADLLHELQNLQKTFEKDMLLITKN